jgi:hypothetical protein
MRGVRGVREKSNDRGEDKDERTGANVSLFTGQPAAPETVLQYLKLADILKTEEKKGGKSGHAPSFSPTGSGA